MGDVDADAVGGSSSQSEGRHNAMTGGEEGAISAKRLDLDVSENLRELSQRETDSENEGGTSNDRNGGMSTKIIVNENNASNENIPTKQSLPVPGQWGERKSVTLSPFSATTGGQQNQSRTSDVLRMTSVRSSIGNIADVGSKMVTLLRKRHNRGKGRSWYSICYMAWLSLFQLNWFETPRTAPARIISMAFALVWMFNSSERI